MFLREVRVSIVRCRYNVVEVGLHRNLFSDIVVEHLGNREGLLYSLGEVTVLGHVDVDVELISGTLSGEGSEHTGLESLSVTNEESLVKVIEAKLLLIVVV